MDTTQDNSHKSGASENRSNRFEVTNLEERRTRSIERSDREHDASEPPIRFRGDEPELYLEFNH